MLLHGSHLHSPSSPLPHSTPMAASTDWDLQARQLSRKRKAETQENERLSKRLSLLNIEQNGSKLYVPVESTPNAESARASTANTLSTLQPPSQQQRARNADADAMQLEDSKHKVYIYNIDDELASDSESDDGRLVFLPDIEKHLRLNRIPPPVLPNSDGELAGMQVVLYNDPKSLTVPEEQDSVRKAILDARRRLRQQQQDAREGTYTTDDPTPSVAMSSPVQNAGATQSYDDEAMDVD